jgi:hypothetical protein
MNKDEMARENGAREMHAGFCLVTLKKRDFMEDRSR